MYTYADLMNNLINSNIDRKGTLLVHSSMKAIGEVDGGADTVLNVLIDYMKEGNISDSYLGRLESRRWNL